MPPWHPTNITDPLDPTILVPLGYSTSLGTLVLLDLDLDSSHLQLPHPLEALGEGTASVGTAVGEEDDISQALRYLDLSQSNHLAHQTTPTMHNFENYQPILGWKPLDVIQKTFEATTQPTFKMPV